MRVGLRRHHDYRGVVTSAQATTHFESRNVRQTNVEQHEIGRIAGEAFDTLLARRCLDNFVTLVLEHETQCRSNVGIVFDEQQAVHVPILPDAGRCHTKRTVPCWFRYIDASMWSVSEPVRGHAPPWPPPVPSCCRT